MRILVVAPHPFYQERGTPIAVDLMVRGLVNAGCEVDLLTFDEGEGRAYPGLRIIRARTVPRVTGVRPGFSGKKLYHDFFLLLRFVHLLLTRRYALVHAVEESAFFAMLLCPLFRVRYVYDMDSSMATQLIDRFPVMRVVEGALRWLERLPARFAAAVVPVCEALAEDVRKVRKEGIFVLKDVSLATTGGSQPAVDLRRSHAIPGKLFMYIGNLESYQGIDLMLEGFALLAPRQPDARLAIIGGEEQHIAHYRSRAGELGVEDAVLFMGKQPVAAIKGFMDQADILLSPRTQGVNTPMKIFSYLDGNAALLATRLPTHTQVLNDDIACLVEPEPAAMAAGMERLMQDEALCQRLTRAASIYVQAEHSYDTFLARLYAIYSHLLPDYHWPARSGSCGESAPSSMAAAAVLDGLLAPLPAPCPGLPNAGPDAKSTRQ
jgi:glycosyltransferase involved in cell wall biosynthesis